MSDPRPISLSEFSLRVAARPANGDWLMLVVPEGRLEDTFETLAVDVEAFTQAVPTTVKGVENARDLVRAIRSTRDKVILIGGLENFSTVEWQSTDLLRSGLEGAPTVVLIATRRQLDLLAQSAPNLASWLVGGIWQLGDDVEEISEAEQRDRLAALRASTGLSDENVIERATNRTLAHDPQFTEWLLLLGRSDLIGRR